PILTIVSSDIRLTHRSLGVAAAPLSHYTLSLHDALPILLHTCVIMGMDHLCVRRIGDPVPVLDHRGSIDHIFIKNSMSGKSSQTFINVFSVCRAHVGTEKSLYHVYRKIFTGFY